LKAWQTANAEFFFRSDVQQGSGIAFHVGKILLLFKQVLHAESKTHLHRYSCRADGNVVAYATDAGRPFTRLFVLHRSSQQLGSAFITTRQAVGFVALYLQRAKGSRVRPRVQRQPGLEF
jgi:hypothetical protein